MSGMTQTKDVAKQYATADNLKTRIAFQQRFSQNQYGFGRWLTDQYMFPENARVLELGCGTGSMWKGQQALIDGFASLTLTDFSEGMLADAQANLSELKGIRFLQADIQDLPFEDASFDFVIANMMLYHVPDKAKAIAEVRRVLRPGGVFVCATYGEEGLPSYMSALLRGIAAIRTMNTTFTLQNGAGMLSAEFGEVEKREYPDEFRVDDAQAVIDYLMSMTGMIMEGGGEFPAEQVRSLLQKKIDAEGALRIPKQYGTFICR